MAHTDSDSTPTTKRSRYRISIRAHEQWWSFAFACEDADIVVDHLAQLVKDPDCDFDRSDAELVCRHLAEVLADAVDAEPMLTDPPCD